MTGEYLSLRYNGGIGLDNINGCFICGGKESMLNNISGFVKSKSSGEKIVAMSNKGVVLDYRIMEPNYIQVKIGSCEQHVENLKNLAKNIIKRGNVILQEDFQ